MRKTKLITEILSLDKTKGILAEIFFNNTSNVSKITDNSVVNAFFYAIARLGQRALSNIAVHESRIFTETATGVYLDDSAKLFGSGERLSASKSSAFVKVYAEAGTQYLRGVHQFKSTTGIVFDIIESKIINENEYGYISLRSTVSGDSANVDANTITKVTPRPSGHISCSNEYMAIGGSDVETDQEFRNRIQSSYNVLSQNTIERLLSVLRLIYPDIIRVFSLGYDSGYYRFGVVSRSGSYLTQTELAELAEKSKDYLSQTDIGASGNFIGYKFENIPWFDVDIDFRCDIPDSYDFDEVRRNIQIRLTEYFDFGLWDFGDIISRSELIYIVSGVEGVNYIPNEHFNPQVDQYTQFGTLPRITSFKMRDLNGNIIYTATSDLDVYYNI